MIHYATFAHKLTGFWLTPPCLRTRRGGNKNIHTLHPPLGDIRMTTSPMTVDEMAAAIEKLRESPALFVEEVLGATPQKWQRKALDAIAKHDKVAIKSGHGVGKTAFESWTVLWWLLTHYPCKAAVTANSAHQLSDVLWTEIDRWARNMPKSFKDLLEFKSDKIAL